MQPAATSLKSIARRSLAAFLRRAAFRSSLNPRTKTKSKVQSPESKVQGPKSFWLILTLDIGHWTLDWMSQIPEKVVALAKAVRNAGGRALLVGGCVRDLLMELEPSDWDLEVYGLEPLKLRTLLDEFGQVNVVGEAFTVYKLGSDLDVSLPRRERKSGRGHRGFVIEGDPAMSFVDATRRRD